MSSTGIWALFAVPWTAIPLQFIRSNYFRLETSTCFPVMKERDKKEKKSGGYKGPRDGKLSPVNPRGKVSFPLRMPPEGKEAWNRDGNSPTAINKGAEYVGKIKPYTPTTRKLVS